MIDDAPSLPVSFTSGEVPAICIAYTAATFNLPGNLILSILKTEDGRVGIESANSNGTFDLGPMQINTIWLTVLKEHAITRAMLRDDGCLNVYVGGWILRFGLNSSRSYWRGVGRYHSATMQPDRDLNAAYAQRVWNNLQNINKLEVSWWGIPGLRPMGATAPTISATQQLDVSSGKHPK